MNIQTPIHVGSETVGPLTQRTLYKLKRYFDSVGHHPSNDMWKALKDIATTLERMVEGTLEQKFHLSSLDPGIGKTQTLSKFADSMLETGHLYGHVGILICLGRLAEIEKLITDMGLSREWLAVYTSDPKVNALGKAEPNDARVLITTQQMIERSFAEAPANASGFEDLDMFHFQGRPRQVRVWDETWLPGETITLNRDEISSLFQPLRPSFAKLIDQFEEFFCDLRKMDDGSTIEVPDFDSIAEGMGYDLNALLALFENARNMADQRDKDRLRGSLSALWFLSGRICSVRRDEAMGNTLLDYKDTMPLDMAPMLILDASGRVRQTYRDVEEHRRTLVRLRSAVKRYEPLTVHVWNRGGSKSAFQRNGDKLVEGVVKTIQTKPDQEWLVVCHRPGNKVGDVEKAIRSELSEDVNERVHFLTWGQHMATNDYADVPNVILAGTLFYRTSDYEALKRLAVGRRAEHGLVTKEERQGIFDGENRHLILQAACRGSVRRCDGEQCHPCDLYIIASVRSGIAQAMPEMFPGCTVSTWTPVKPELRGKVKEAYQYLKKRLRKSRDPHFYIPFADIQKAVRMEKANFKNDVRQKEDFQEAVASLGLAEWGSGKLFTGYRKVGNT